MEWLGRRQFLVRTGLGLAAAALASAPADTLQSLAQTAPPDWSAVRGLFQLDPDFIHFGGLYLASHPAPVRDAIESHRNGLDANAVDYLHQNQARLEADVLRGAAAYLGVSPVDIALTDSTTMGLGLLYNGLDVRADQELLTTTHDFYATHEALRLKSQRSGASMRRIALYANPANATEDEIVGALAAALTPGTRVVAVTWVHSSTGVKLPIRALADVVAEANASREPGDRALLCVDGVHGLGVEDNDLLSLGCDFFVAGCHKWLFGPRGTGFVWGNQRAWSAAMPTIPTFSDAANPASSMTPGGFHSFEHRWALAQAFDLHRQLGRSAVSARIHDLNRDLKEGLAALAHVRLHTPLDDNLSAGLVCFEIVGLSPQQVVDRLHADRIIATVTPYSTSYARLAAGLMNSPEEVDRVLASVAALA
jgi:selenocysteine lyase/cysteine desulfurase